MLVVEQFSNIQLADATITSEPPTIDFSSTLKQSCNNTINTNTPKSTENVEKLNELKNGHVISKAELNHNGTVPIANTTETKTDDESEKVYRYFGIEFKAPFKWFNLIMINAFHLYFLYNLKIVFTAQTLWPNLIWGE